MSERLVARLRGPGTPYPAPLRPDASAWPAASRFTPFQVPVLAERRMEMADPTDHEGL